MWPVKMFDQRLVQSSEKSWCTYALKANLSANCYDSQRAITSLNCRNTLFEERRSQSPPRLAAGIFFFLRHETIDNLRRQ
jgi:hypothetical protein